VRRKQANWWDGRLKSKKCLDPVEDASNEDGKGANARPAAGSLAMRSMMKDGKDRDGPHSAKAAKDPRQERLKRALRENLKRRKSQARERGDCLESSLPEEAARDEDGESPAK
jgi:hypothetical protein